MRDPLSLGFEPEEEKEQESTPAIPQIRQPAPSIREAVERGDPVQVEKVEDESGALYSRAQTLINAGIKRSTLAVERKTRLAELTDMHIEALERDQSLDVGLDAVDYSRNVLNFLIGDDAAVVGFQWDEDGLSWNLDNAIQQWSDQPMLDSVLKSVGLATWALPVVGAVNKSLKFGNLGKRFAGKSFQYVDDLDNSKSFRWYEKFKSQEDEVAWLTEKGILKEGATPSRSVLASARSGIEAEQRAAKMKAIDKAIERGENTIMWGGETIKIGAVDRAKSAFHKRFANAYWNITNLRADSPKDAVMMKAFQESLSSFSKAENWGKLFRDAPDEVLNGNWNKDIVAFWNDNAAGLPADMGDEAIDWTFRLNRLWQHSQKEALEEGLIDQVTRAKIGPAHIPAIEKGTPHEAIFKGRTQLAVTGRPPETRAGKVQTTLKGLTEEGVPIVDKSHDVLFEVVDWPAIFSDRLKYRGRSGPQFMQDIYDGKVITDPLELIGRGLIVDRQLLHNFKFLRDYVTGPGNSIAREAFDVLDDKAKKAYIDLENWDNLGGAREILRRMINKKNPDFMPDGRLPVIERSVAEQWFGEAGMFHQSQIASNVFEALVALHKTVKTAFNPPTQVTNILGNMAFQSWAGMNPLAPEALDAAATLTGGFRKLAKVNKELQKQGVGLSDLMSDPKMMKQLDLGKVAFKGPDGKKVTFNLAEEMSDPMFKNLIEEQAFESVEGLGMLENIYGRMAEGLPKKFVGSILGVRRARGVGKVIDESTSMYLMGDMVPKAQLYLKMQAQGMTREAAAIHVARHMPMYGSVGKSVAGMRKMWLPWVTFPAEALRIMKNTMMDHPLRLLPWLQATDTMQTLMFGIGGIEGPEAAQAAMQNLPLWAQSPTTVVGQGPQAASAQAGFTGATGGMIGGVLTGAATGARGLGAAGAVAGAATGLLASELWADHVEPHNQMRGMMMRWLPHSSVMLAHRPSPIDASSPMVSAQRILEVSPVQPMAIYEPMLNIITGQTAYGTPVRAETGMDMAGKMMAGLVGFIAPPMVQTYGYRVSSPDIPIGGTRVAGLGPGGALGGAAAGAAIGASAGGAPGAIAGGIAGGVAGGIANVSRIGIDMGTEVDTRTMKLKEPFADFLLNNIGAIKSYAALPEHRAQNEAMVKREFTELRTHLKKQAMYHIVNGNEDRVSHYLNKVHGSFVRQNPFDPRAASREFADWMERFLDDVGESPMWGSYSKDDLKAEMRKAMQRAGENRGRAHDEWIGALRQQRRMR